MIRVTNIQRFAISDGPGIRTTVFLKGCTLKCPWCSNPENLDYEFTPYKRASADGSIVSGVYGKDYSAEELRDIIMKDKKFYRKNGGVTFSGGEPLFQAYNLVKLLSILNDEGINIGFETSLHIPEKFLDICLPYMNFAYVDIKILDNTLCSKVLGGNVENYINNVRNIHKSKSKMIFRIPCSNEFTLTGNNICLIRNMLREFSGHRIEIFKVHNLGNEKYKSMGCEAWLGSIVENSALEEFANLLMEDNNDVHIIEV